MFRKLFIVFVSGIVLAAAALAGAWAIGGQEFKDSHGWSWDSDAVHLGPRKTRQLDLVSGQQLTIEVPANLDFVRGTETRMEIDGPEQVVDKLVWEDGHLSMPKGTRMGGNLKIRIVAPEIGSLAFEAPGDVDLRDLDQEKLTLDSAGAIDFDATGKVRTLKVSAAGAADIDAGKLAVEDADVEVSGAGDITLAAIGVVKVVINGAGDVTLLRKPRKLDTQINGVGSVDHDYEEGDGRNDTTVGF